ncbi:MAG: nuclear transport factor 2 family protein [Candidatus Latescibacter sp.]|nr:nuclear transport factor 2 family protein [Candidatus Latescibacter sp.]
MFRTVCISVFIILCIAFSAVVYAQETQDQKAVRSVIEKELKGALEGKPDQMKSCYTPDFVGFSAYNSGDVCMHKIHLDGVTQYFDPEDWVVSISTPKELDTYAEYFRNYPEKLAKSAIKRGNEVATVKVKDNFAIAVTRHWGTWLDKTTNENVRFEGRSVWMLKKTGGEWKIFSNIGQVSLGIITTKAFPE